LGKPVYFAAYSQVNAFMLKPAHIFSFHKFAQLAIWIPAQSNVHWWW